MQGYEIFTSWLHRHHYQPWVNSLLYRQFSEDAQGSWMMSPMNMAWSVLSVYTLSFCFLDWAAELQGDCCLTLCLLIRAESEIRKTAGLVLHWLAAGLANISRYHNKMWCIVCVCVCVCVCDSCVHSLSLPCLQRAGCGFTRSWLLSLQVPKWWVDLSTSVRTAASLTAWTENSSPR